MPDTARGRILASPVARKIATSAKLSLRDVAGSGPFGRIIKRDIVGVLSGGPGGRSSAAAARAIAATQPKFSQRDSSGVFCDAVIRELYPEGSYEYVPHDGMRLAIADRLGQSKQTIPHYYLNIDVRVDALLASRKLLNAPAKGRTDPGYALSVTDYLIKAFALALQDIPQANSTWVSGGVLRHHASNVGVAVDVEGGLYTPIIRQAEQKPLSVISRELTDLTQRARAGTLQPCDYQGGSSVLSNLGMYGIKQFCGVINPPHATLLAIGEIERRPIVIEDRVAPAAMMNCTLSCDHRVVDGAVGARLLSAFKAYVADPVRMLL